MRQLLIAVGLLLGCAAPMGPSEENPFRPGLWPFYTSDARSWAGVRETRALGPILHWENDGQRYLFETRPGFSSLAAPEQARRDIFYPVAGCRERPDRDNCSLLFLMSHRRDHTLGSRWTHLALAFWGRTQRGESYGGLFPLFGSFRNRFGYDRIRFVLWPLYARGERDGYRETHVLWPIFAWGSGDGRRELRVWPLFGSNRREGVHVRRFFLWPLVHDRRERLDAEHPERTFYVLPLYGRRDRGAHASRFYLFPLVLRQWNREKPEVGRLDLLWPIYSRGRAADGSELFAVRPLYMRSSKKDEEKRSWLFGLLAHTQIHDEAGDQDLWRVLWAGRVAERAQGDERIAHLDVWPFYRSLRVREADGHEHGFARTPYLIPMRGLDPDNWNRHYNQFFELYGRRWRDDEERRTWLFGLREERRSAREAWVSWGGFLHLRRAVDRN